MTSEQRTMAAENRGIVQEAMTTTSNGVDSVSAEQPPSVEGSTVTNSNTSSANADQMPSAEPSLQTAASDATHLGPEAASGGVGKGCDGRYSAPLDEQTVNMAHGSSAKAAAVMADNVALPATTSSADEEVSPTPNSTSHTDVSGGTAPGPKALSGRVIERCDEQSQHPIDEIARASEITHPLADHGATVITASEACTGGAEERGDGGCSGPINQAMKASDIPTREPMCISPSTTKTIGPHPESHKYYMLFHPKSIDKAAWTTKDARVGENHQGLAQTDEGSKTPESINGTLPHGESLQVPSGTPFVDPSSSCNMMSKQNDEDTISLGKLPPKGPAASRAAPIYTPTKARLLDVSGTTASPPSQTPAKRSSTPNETLGLNKPPKRRKNALDVLSKSLQDAVADRPQLPRPVPDTIAAGSRSLQTPSSTTPSYSDWWVTQNQRLTNPTNHILKDESQDAVVKREGLQDMVVTRDIHSTRPSTYIKTEPEQEPAAPYVADTRASFQFDIFKIFENHTMSATEWRQLTEVQSRMTRYVSAPVASEKFDIVEAIPKTIVLSSKRLNILRHTQNMLNKQRASRLQRLPKKQQQNGFAVDTPEWLASHDRPTTWDAKTSPLPVAASDPQQSQRPVQAFNPFQDPPARAMAQETCGPSVVLHNGRPTGPLVQGTPAVSPAPEDGRISPAVRNPTLLQTRGSRPSSLTVLTLPPLNVSQTPQTFKVAREIMDEANSLLSIYSNVRLAFSAQDIRRT